MDSVLLIDDEKALHMMIEGYFQRRSITMYSAVDGKTGIEMALQHHPSVILCDLSLPDTDGFEIYQTLREEMDLSGTPFIMLSATADRSIVREGMSLGIDDYLTKPFSLKELDHAIAARLRRMEEGRAKFQTTITTLREKITYVLPHELRTPLMAVLGYAELLEQGIDSRSREELSVYISSLLVSGKRLHRVVENLLVYTQIQLISTDSVRMAHLRNNLVRANVVIERTASELAETYDRANDLQMQLELGAIRMSSDNLEKIIYELVDNAFKFSQPGTPVSLRLRRDGDYYILWIRDRGRGMSQEDIDNLGAFMQFDRGEHEQQGIGFGLIIARQMVELHLGNFELSSRVGEGTVVRIDFNNQP
jgi:two-component system sensor histidine kinase/response regulator